GDRVRVLPGVAGARLAHGLHPRWPDSAHRGRGRVARRGRPSERPLGRAERRRAHRPERRLRRRAASPLRRRIGSARGPEGGGRAMTRTAQTLRSGRSGPLARKWVVLVLGVTLSTASAASASDEAAGTRSPFASGAGIRARALGGAFAAIGGDAAALSWNPAGLADV